MFFTDVEHTPRDSDFSITATGCLTGTAHRTEGLFWPIVSKCSVHQRGKAWRGGSVCGGGHVAATIHAMYVRKRSAGIGLGSRLQSHLRKQPGTDGWRQVLSTGAYVCGGAFQIQAMTHRVFHPEHFQCPDVSRAL